MAQALVNNTKLKPSLKPDDAPLPADTDYITCSGPVKKDENSFQMKTSNNTGHIYWKLPTKPKHVRMWKIRIDSLTDFGNLSELSDFLVYIGVQDVQQKWKDRIGMQQPLGFTGLSSTGHQWSSGKFKQGRQTWRGFREGETIVVAYEPDGRRLLFCEVDVPYVPPPPPRDNEEDKDELNDSEKDKDEKEKEKDKVSDTTLRLKRKCGVPITSASHYNRFAVFLRGRGTKISIIECEDIREEKLRFIGSDTIPSLGVRCTMLKPRVKCLEFGRYYQNQKAQRFELINPWTIRRKKKGAYATAMCGYDGDSIMPMDKQKGDDEEIVNLRKRFRMQFRVNRVTSEFGFYVGFVHSAIEENDYRLPVGLDEKRSMGLHIENGRCVFNEEEQRLLHDNTAYAGEAFPVPGQEWRIEFDFKDQTFSLFLCLHNQWLLAASLEMPYGSVIPAFTLLSEGDEIQIV